MSDGSKNLEAARRVSFLFPICLGRSKETLLAGYRVISSISFQALPRCTFVFQYLVFLLDFFFLCLLGIRIPSRTCAMESVGPSFRKKQIGNTQPRRYIPRLLKVLSQSINYLAGVFKIDNRQNTIPFPLI